MPKQKSKVQLLDELAVAAVCTLQVAKTENKVPPINDAYITICLMSGRVQEVITHLHDVQATMSGKTALTDHLTKRR